MIKFYSKNKKVSQKLISIKFFYKMVHVWLIMKDSLSLKKKDLSIVCPPQKNNFHILIKYVFFSLPLSKSRPCN